MPDTFGATDEDWAHFDLVLDLGEDLLPTVCDPSVPIAPASTIKEHGRTPSRINRNGQLVGIKGWTQIKANGEIKDWSRDTRLGICVQTRRGRGIDVDVPDPAKAQRIADAAQRILKVKLPVRRRENTGKRLLMVIVKGEIKKTSFAVDGGQIEFLGNGNMFVAAGARKDGSRYYWEDGLPIDIPEITVEQYQALIAQLAKEFAVEPVRETSGADRKLGDDLDVEDPVADWLEAEGLVLGETRDGTIMVECPWNDEHTSGEPGDSSTVWFRAGTNGHPSGHFKCMHAHCTGRNRSDFLAAVGFDGGVADDFEDLGPDPDAGQGEKQAESGPRFQVIPAFLFTQRPAPQWIIKGLIPEADLAILYGESGSGKSFVMIDLAMAVARGLDWRGLKTRQGRVVYIAAEGGGGFRNRLLAYAHQHQIDLEQVPFGVIHATPNFLEKGDIKALIAAIKAGGPVSLIITDTYAQVTPGANENSAEDMGKALRHARMITDETGGMMVLVHHAGKDSTKGARGWSGNHAAADAVLEVTRNGNQRALRTAKQKDGDDEAAWGFTLETVTIGLDEDGEPIDSCVVLEAAVAQKADGKKPEKKMGDWEKAVVDTYAELAVGGDVLKSELILRVGDLFPEKGTVKFRRASARRALKNLSAMFNVDGEYVFEAQ